MLQMRRISAAASVAMVAMAFVVFGGVRPHAARSSSAPLYVALGDSVEFGVGDDIAADGFGYVSPFGVFLSSTLGQSFDVQNLGVGGATTREIMLTQLPAALTAIEAHQPGLIVVSWGGGGNDGSQIALSPQAAACGQAASCLGRFNAALNEAEQAIDRTIGQLRLAAGPDAIILMRTQYNGLKRTGCQTPQNVALASATLEGAPDTVLDRGLNDRIREIAARYDARVVDLFPTFFVFADQLISPDCSHPNGAGYRAILSLFAAALQ